MTSQEPWEKLCVVGLKDVQGSGGLPRWCRGKESAQQCRRWGFNPWVGKIP